MFALTTGLAALAAGPSVWTDKPDYVPEETVTIYGAGFAPGPITLTVTRPDGRADSVPGVSADSAGNFKAAYQLDGIAGTYTVAATDFAGQTAQTTFTDGNVSTSAIPSSVTVTSGGTSASFTIRGTVTGSVGTGRSYSVNTVYSISSGVCTGSSSVSVAVSPQGGGSPTNYDTSATVSAESGQSAGTFSCTLTPTINSGGSGAALAVGTVGTLTVTVNVSNTAPVLGAIGDQTVDEGAVLSFTASAVDADIPANTLTYSLVGAPAGASINGSTGVFSWTPTDNGSFTFTVKVCDNGSPVLCDEEAITVTVNNVAPTVGGLSLSASSINENGSVTLTVSCTDQGTADTWTALVSWGDGSPAQNLDVTCNLGTFTVDHQYLDDNPTGTSSDFNTITVTVTDDDGGSNWGSMNVTVNNVAPAIIDGIVPTDPMAVGTTASVTVYFTDVGIADTHTCLFSWDDGKSSSGAVAESSGSGSCTGVHTYAAAGVYTVNVRVTDDDTGWSSWFTYTQFIVVYDPSAGFVTGGGWINSQAGAYFADLALTGKASFGFVSKYQKGASIPTGETEFQFRAGNLNFHSSSYEWLVVSGAKAQYKGVGTINGAGNYGFLLTATDGQVSGGGGVDKFRIKIWNKDTNTIVYDNAQGSDDVDSSPQQAIAEGSIVIHTGKK
ncbi:MAG: putative Ig domain-containing protein [Chloroflexi bacterium]|nr:putative Ig domain-containing protein [Chloroflexota bacterium]